MKKVVMSAVGVLAVMFLGQATVRGEDLDKDFLIKAFTCSTAEVKYTDLVESRASNDKVKQFAKKIAKEHKECNEKLAEHAKGLKVAVLAGLEKDKQAIYDRLAKLKGTEFDKAYMKQVIEDHEQGVKLFEAQAKKGTHKELKEFAEKTLPKIEDHLKEARNILKEIEK